MFDEISSTVGQWIGAVGGTITVQAMREYFTLPSKVKSLKNKVKALKNEMKSLKNEMRVVQQMMLGQTVYGRNRFEYERQAQASECLFEVLRNLRKTNLSRHDLLEQIHRLKEIEKHGYQFVLGEGLLYDRRALRYLQSFAETTHAVIRRDENSVPFLLNSGRYLEVHPQALTQILVTTPDRCRAPARIVPCLLDFDDPPMERPVLFIEKGDGKGHHATESRTIKTDVITPRAA